MSGHTPGPWLLEIDADESATVYVDATLGRFEIAGQVGGEVRPDEEGDYSDYSEVHANARLIAAAPDLLEALKEIKRGRVLGDRSDLSAMQRMMDIALAAIAKAEGKT